MSANTIVKVEIDASAAIELLAAVRGSIGARRDVNDAAANAVAVQVRAWLAARNRARSRHVESQYWAHAAESVSARGLPDAALVVIRHPGVAWHLHGGTIRARPGKALAIPLRDAVYGMRPSELFTSRADAFVYRRRGRAYLAARPDKGVKAGNRTLRILYLLLKSVSKPADIEYIRDEDNNETIAIISNPGARVTIEGTCAAAIALKKGDTVSISNANYIVETATTRHSRTATRFSLTAYKPDAADFGSTGSGGSGSGGGD